jgi:putative SOS response-associated peptidase YedK
VWVPSDDDPQPHHDRTTAILSPDDSDKWLDAGTKRGDLKALLRTYLADLMEVTEANPLVNNPKNEGT